MNSFNVASIMMSSKDFEKPIFVTESSIVSVMGQWPQGSLQHYLFFDESRVSLTYDIRN